MAQWSFTAYNWQADERVLQGIAWLDEHAPPNWIRHLFMQFGSEYLFIGTSSHNGTSVLTLAFTDHPNPRFKGVADEKLEAITLWSVAHFNGLNSFELEKRGFLGVMYMSVESWQNHVSDALIGAWERNLRERFIQKRIPFYACQER